MTNEELLLAGAVNAWKANLERADKLFSGLTPDELSKEIAPGKNRLIYIWGHLIAVNDRLLPLLDFGPRLHPEFDTLFITNPDRTSPGLPSAEELKKSWDKINSKLSEGIEKLSASEWLRKHTSVSEEDFGKDPLRNRFSVLVSRTNHLAFHLGQLELLPK